MGTVSSAAEGVFSITMTSTDTLAVSPSVCPTSNAVAYTVDGSNRVVSSSRVAIMPGHDPSIADASTSV
jgi:predicted RecA/RadA family phage recombinase